MKNDNIEQKANWKAIAGWLIIVVVLLVFTIIYLINSSSVAVNEKPSEPTVVQSSSTSENNNENVSTIDDLMTDFTGTDEEVQQLCESELQALDIEYVSIDEPIENNVPFIQETRVGTYELNGILRTPSNSSDMPQPKSTEMLCTIFPGDEDPVEITFGKDW